MIELRNITKQFGENVIFQNVNAVVHPGDVIAVIGPSGCGKSTLLNCINLLVPASGGQVLFEGVDLMDKSCDLNHYRQKIGMVFQSFNLFSHMTVLENVMKPQVTLLHRSREEACEKAMHYLSMVGMADRALRYPDDLSGGQKQRVAIARTLAMDPELILMDEPTSALDPTMVGEVEYVLKKLAKEGRTMLIVTHDMRLARELSSRVFYMDEKGIYEDGPTEQIFDHPLREKTRSFVNRIKTLELSIDSKYFDYIGAMREIELYSDKLGFSKQNAKKLQLLFEEACMELILPRLGEKPTLRAVFEYEEKNESLRLTLHHAGAPVLHDGGDSSSQRIIDSMRDFITIAEVTE